jgi:hypothetical protein
LISDYLDGEVFVGALRAVAGGNGDGNFIFRSEGLVGFKLILVGDFKVISVIDGKSESIISIYIVGRECANIGAGRLPYDKSGVAELPKT